MSPPPPPSDRLRMDRQDDDALAQLAGAGSRDALEVLLRRHQSKIFATCRRLCDSDADAYDATQDTLLNVARRIDRFDGRAAFSTWLYRVATNACYDELRRKRRRPAPVDTMVEPVASPGRTARATGTAGADHAEQVSDRLMLEAAIAEVRAEYRQPLVLRDVAGLDYAAIAEVLDIPPGTVRSRIARGRAQLSELISMAGNHEGASGRLRTEARHRSSSPTPPGESAT
ncbi:MAG: sigma-70 family RNA polymerase sigma factor [Acidimicrobiia bacterium]|nr:sigma-70 family RNA polymerase sigma factor [Acidimicrobiia bacterium]